MSLDVDLLGPEITVACECADCGHVHERKKRENYFDWNITDNLNRMASEAGIYEVLWRPEEVGITTAAQLIDPLRVGLAKLHSDPFGFKQWNPENGWGDYEGLVRFVAIYLDACQRHPDATVSVSR